MSQHANCVICLEEISCDSDNSIPQCLQCRANFHHNCIFTWMNTNTQRTCPHCRTRRSIMVDGQFLHDNEIVYYGNGNKKYESVVEELHRIERRWWSDGNPKYEIILNADEEIIRGTYYTYKGAYDVKTLSDEEIYKVRTNPIYNIMVNNTYL